MAEQNAFEIHPIHAVFPFIHLSAIDSTIEDFFALLDEVEAIDRDGMIGLTSFALMVEVPQVDDEELMRSRRYEAFKEPAAESRRWITLWYGWWLLRS